MADGHDAHEFEIARDVVYRYSLATSTLVILLLTGWFFGTGLILALVWYVSLGPWLHRRQVDALRYRLEGSTIRIDQGFIFLQRKSIPLDRVTDVVLSQGPLARHFGIWTMKIQTAGTGQQMAEGVMVGVVDAEAARDLLIRRRDEVARGNTSGS